MFEAWGFGFLPGVLVSYAVVSLFLSFVLYGSNIMILLFGISLIQLKGLHVTSIWVVWSNLYKCEEDENIWLSFIDWIETMRSISEIWMWLWIALNIINIKDGTWWNMSSVLQNGWFCIFFFPFELLNGALGYGLSWIQDRSSHLKVHNWALL